MCNYLSKINKHKLRLENIILYMNNQISLALAFEKKMNLARIHCMLLSFGNFFLPFLFVRSDSGNLCLALLVIIAVLWLITVNPEIFVFSILTYSKVHELATWHNEPTS